MKDVLVSKCQYCLGFCPQYSSRGLKKNLNELILVVAHLLEQLLPRPEIRGSNPVIGKFYILLTVLKR